MSCDAEIIASASIVGPLTKVISVACVFVVIAGYVVIYAVGCVIVITGAIGSDIVVPCISLNFIEISPSAVLP